MKSFQITEWCHELFLMQAVTGGTYIDATMGNGHDTLFLCRLAGKEGQVLAFDIQKQALESTRALLKSQPRLNDRKGKELYTLEGTPPILKNIPEGCPFCFRCENAMNICVKKMPKATVFNEEHKASCWLFHNENVRSEGEING